MPRVRVGIDVGGTFTHAVALDASTDALLAHAVVLTTHKAKEGVALGIVQSLQKLIKDAPLDRPDVTFIAHSTTQATNALLEGDTSSVGIMGMGEGLEGSRAKSESEIGKVKLFSGSEIDTVFDFIRVHDGSIAQDEIVKKIEGLIKKGSQTIVAAEAFSVDKPDNENSVADVCSKLNIPCVATHEISGLYGLRARTRTSVINASILPKMLEAADMTEKATKDSGITASLMIMRSDGGVLSLAQARKRPIMTILSGPAAGVASALMYEKISDAIFLEVGGTSTDITVIKDGRALVKSAEVGGQRLYLKTLDVRTVGLAGGSMPRIRDKRIFDVGPRSAHIAGLSYASFLNKDLISNARVKLIRPKPNDPDDYLAFEGPESSFAVTTTCAANALGLIPEGDWAFGNRDSAICALSLLGDLIGRSAEEAAEEILISSTKKFTPVIETLIRDYRLDRKSIVLVGAGGGASAIVPFLAKTMKLSHRIVANNHVASAIGVALALIHESVERSVIEATDKDILRVKKEAVERVIAMGARQETVEVQIEVDPKRNIIRASAFGAAQLRSDKIAVNLSPENKMRTAASSMGIDLQNVKLAASTQFLSVFSGEAIQKRFFGLFNDKRTPVRVVDPNGVVRLKRTNALVRSAKAGNAAEEVREILRSRTRYGDFGEKIPALAILYGARILDLSGLTSELQITGLLEIELEGMLRDDNIIIVADLN
jgi:N-methylhydantoinase A/oxoprolinase/acetone carboxylase beta subunit